jgi:hypothetical protein
MPLPRLLPIVHLALLAAGLAWPGPAAAAPGAEVGMEDERLLLSEPARAPETVAVWAALGVETVRVQARWFEVAPAQRSTRPPRGFRPGNHRDRRYDWDRWTARSASSARTGCG